MSQLLFDQFDVEPDSMYGGGYTDGVFAGAIGSVGGRFLVATVSSGSDELNYAQRYSVFADHSGSNRRRSLGSTLRARTFFTTTERYYDTLLPDIFSIFNGKPVLGYGDMGTYPVLLAESGSIAYNTGYNSPAGKLVFAVYGATASYPGKVVSDNVWLASSPFQRRYLDITRVVDPIFYRPNIICSATESQWAADGFYHYGLNDSTIFARTSLSSVEIMVPRIIWRDGTLAGNANSEPYRFTMMDITGSVTGEKFYNLGSVLYPPLTTGTLVYTQGTVRPAEKQITKCIFGFGDNTQGVPIINAVAANKLQNTEAVVNGYYASSVDIRGWRYGVINGFPLYSSCVFRSSRYGQFRDMLEQRKFTKFFDPSAFNGKGAGKKGLINGAIGIVFVSGSQAFASASEPIVLNVNDSGIYDFEYKSGQPWHDM